MSNSKFSSPVPMIKLKDFTGSVFSEWKRNTQFGMRFLNLYYTVKSDFESCKEDVDEYQWSKDEEFCKDYILNCLSTRLAETYSQLKTAKEIWDALDAQFKKEEDLSKTHLVDKFMAFTFDESKPILTQVRESVTVANGDKVEVHQTRTADLLLSSGVKNVAGDLFVSIPRGDAILLKMILHDWSDEQSVQILKNCYKALPISGKVIVVEQILPEIPEKNNAVRDVYFMDLCMMVSLHGAKERTEKEFRALASDAGFSEFKIACYVMNYHVMEFVK